MVWDVWRAEGGQLMFGVGSTTTWDSRANNALGMSRLDALTEIFRIPGTSSSRDNSVISGSLPTSLAAQYFEPLSGRQHHELWFDGGLPDGDSFGGDIDLDRWGGTCICGTVGGLRLGIRQLTT